ncbi:MAG: hypothetical protein ACLPTQ_08255 [Terriglobales bacterium]
MKCKECDNKAIGEIRGVCLLHASKEHGWYLGLLVSSVRPAYTMSVWAQHAIKCGIGRETFVDRMLALRPRLKRNIWAPQLERAYDTNLHLYYEVCGDCGTCGKPCTYGTADTCIGGVMYHTACRKPITSFTRCDYENDGNRCGKDATVVVGEQNVCEEHAGK